MSEPRRILEIDERFPTGEWIGFFIQPDSPRRYRMELALEFAEGNVAGEGADSIGEFVIVGDYDTADGCCSWSKQYLGRHRVDYSGYARCGGIVGTWTIPGNPQFWAGPYFVWPRAAGELSANFEQALLEVEFSSEVDEVEVAPARV